MRFRSDLGVLSLVLGLSCGWLWWESDGRTRELLGTTAGLALSVVAISVPCGVLLASLVARTNVPGRTLASVALFGLLLIPVYLQAAGWDAGFGRMGWFSLAREAYAEPWLFGMRGAVWVHALAAVPWVFFIVGSALRLVDPDLEESALLDSPPASVLLRISLPSVRPAIAAAALWVMVQATTEITVTDLYQVRTVAEEVYTSVQVLEPTSTVDEEGAASLPLGLGGLIAVSVIALVLAGTLARQSLRPPIRPSYEFNLGAWRIPAGVFLGLAILAIIGVPMTNLVYNAGASVEGASGLIARNWSAGKAWEMVWLTPGKFWDEFRWTTVLGVLTATTCAVGAIPLAMMARRGGWWSFPGMLVVGLGIAVPGPLVSLAIIRLLNQPDMAWLAWLYDHTLLAPWLATTIRAIPAAILVTWYAILSLPSDLTDAASVDGLGAVGVFVRIVLPLRWPQLLLAWLVAFVVATGDLSASILVTPPGLFTVPVRVFGLLHAGVDDQVAGLCLVAVLAYGFVMLVGLGLLSRRSLV
jgi:iron(III) transport system permease protein